MCGGCDGRASQDPCCTSPEDSQSDANRRGERNWGDVDQRVRGYRGGEGISANAGPGRGLPFSDSEQCGAPLHDTLGFMCRRPLSQRGLKWDREEASMPILDTWVGRIFRLLAAEGGGHVGCLYLRGEVGEFWKISSTASASGRAWFDGGGSSHLTRPVLSTRAAGVGGKWPCTPWAWRGGVAPWPGG